ncbi:hypothetical protein O181_003610 [Austropuccinia psidii MF-1]|uniref:CCHC-type domain-containing protein n=1 Tax=Austropuccinia psidii MF-1 TaxID=1389203 RepID=A0A9Q3BER9_9BASI|nr:hypothetical protein [Austropuccinia psidii MF-1]
MELNDYIEGLFIDVPSIPDYWITARLNTEFKGNAIIWYTEMKDIHGRRNLPWWKSKKIHKYSNGTWILQNTMSFENDKYPVYKDPHECCLRQVKRLKGIDHQMNIQMSNHKLLTQMPGELEHVIRCTCNQSFTLYYIANTLKYLRKRKNMGNDSSYRGNSSKEKPPYRLNSKDRPKEKIEDVTKLKNTCHNCGSTDHYARNCPKEKKKIYSIEKVPEEETQDEDSGSDSIGDAIREISVDEPDPMEEFLVHHNEETQLEISI